MPHHPHAAAKPDDESASPFMIRKDGRGVDASWQTIVAVLTGTAIAATAWASLKYDSAQHASAISEMKSDVKGVQASAAQNHDDLMAQKVVISGIDGKIDRLLERNRP